jgi:hypothetical protein
VESIEPAYPLQGFSGAAAPARPPKTPGVPLMRLRCLSACSCPGARGVLVGPTLLVLQPEGPDLEVFAPRPPAGSKKPPDETLPGFRSTSGTDPTALPWTSHSPSGGCRIFSRHRPVSQRPVTRRWPATRSLAPLLEFLPLRRMSSRGVRSTRACLTRHLPAPGFLTLLPACSSSSPAGLFRPANALGVVPSKAFPLRPR